MATRRTGTAASVAAAAAQVESRLRQRKARGGTGGRRCSGADCRRRQGGERCKRRESSTTMHDDISVKIGVVCEDEKKIDAIRGVWGRRGREEAGGAQDEDGEGGRGCRDAAACAAQDAQQKKYARCARRTCVMRITNWTIRQNIHSEM